MTDRFEMEVDSTAVNETWPMEVVESLKARQAAETQEQPTKRACATSEPRRRTSTGWPARCSNSAAPSGDG
ncbi:hypothetical protein JDV09_07540 [Mycobacterium sp. Y57]|nr:hypothetical protein [Mycolicibacterium xanthum]